MTFMSHIENNTTKTVTKDTSGMWGYVEGQEGWFDLDEAEYLAGSVNGIEIQMDCESFTLYDCRKEDVVEVAVKVVNKKKLTGKKPIHVLFGFELDSRKYTAFLNTFADGRRYIGIAAEKPFNPDAPRRKI